MLDIGWTELLLIGIIALIVVGPKDLPGMFRNLGRVVGRARGMAHEFKRAMESAADESGVKDVARDLKDTASGKNMGLDEFRDIAKSPKSWAKDQALGSGGDKRKKDAADDAGEAAADEADAEAVKSKESGTSGRKPGPGPATKALSEKRAAEAQARRTGAAESTDKPDDAATGSKSPGAKGKTASAKGGNAGKAATARASRSTASTTQAAGKAKASGKSAGATRSAAGKAAGADGTAAGKAAPTRKKAATSGKSASGTKSGGRSKSSGDA